MQRAVVREQPTLCVLRSSFKMDALAIMDCAIMDGSASSTSRAAAAIADVRDACGKLAMDTP